MGLDHNRRGRQARTAIGAKILSINLLLATHTLEWLSEFRAQAQLSHTALIAKINAQRIAMTDIGRDNRATKDSVDSLTAEQTISNKALGQKIDYVKVSLRGVNDTMSSQLLSFRDLGAQLTDILHRWPRQVRETLKQAIQSNLQMYAILRVIHTNTLRSPQHDPADAFRFEDALGRTHNLPYQYFRHKTEFKGVPGERRVEQGQYLILDNSSGQEPVGEHEWTFKVFTGSRLAMSIFMELSTDSLMEEHCLKIGCTGVRVRQQRQSQFAKW